MLLEQLVIHRGENWDIYSQHIIDTCFCVSGTVLNIIYILTTQSSLLPYEIGTIIISVLKKETEAQKC